LFGSGTPSHLCKVREHGWRRSAFGFEPQSREEEPGGPIIGRIEGEHCFVTAQAARYRLAKLSGNGLSDTCRAGSGKAPGSPNRCDQPHAIPKIANVAVSPTDNCIAAIVVADAESMALREMLYRA
jgi:hypothetical protein